MILVMMMIIIITIFFFNLKIQRSRKRHSHFSKYGNKLNSEHSALRIVFLHPDFGIGGAENLIVNAACVMQNKGHNVTIYTAHHDLDHCFDETRGNGQLAHHVVVHGDWLPKTFLSGRCYALCANLRMLYLATVVIAFESQQTDVFFIDQVSIPILLLKLLTRIPVLFYCHFPDKLLCTTRRSLLKRLYRIPIDFLEEFTTGLADCILVNSSFTASVFAQSFPRLKNRTCHTLYPPVNVDAIRKATMTSSNTQIADDTILFCSLNRFELKKNIGLAIQAYSVLKTLIPSDVFAKTKLVLAGGYDNANAENATTYEALTKLVATTPTLAPHITFEKSISANRKIDLLVGARAILYTPSNEHFGIVPVEAMCASTPVIAVNNGGPCESIVDGTTGFLCDPTPLSFAMAMAALATDPKLHTTFGAHGKQRVSALFSLQTFGDLLERHLVTLVNPSQDGKSN